MDVRLPDGTVIRGVPDGMSKADLTAKLARNGYDVAKLGAPSSMASQIPSHDRAYPPTQADYAQERINQQLPPDISKDTLLQKIGGVGETALSLGTGMVGGAVGGIAGLYKGVTGGKYGTQAGVREAADTAHEVAGNLTYQPRTQTGQKLTQAAGDVINQSGIIGVAPMVGDMAALSRGVSAGKRSLKGLAGPGAEAMAAQDAAMAAGGGGIRDLMSAPKQMSGGGAALSDVAKMRLERAASMPVPPKLTRGQATREFKDIQFERETAKNPDVGGALRNRYSEQNQNTLQNIDAYFDATGATTPNLRATGTIVTDALVKKAADAKTKIRSAYNEARAAGDMSHPVDYKPLSDYLAAHETEAITGNASMLKSVSEKLQKLDPEGTGKITINDMEELRKMAGNLTAPGTPNTAFIGPVKELMDAATDGQGGMKYQQARRMYENYSNEFKNAGVIDKMMRTKPGTKDRAVAYEDIYNHAIEKGSLDDVRAVRRTLQTAGKDGSQAWRELQGQGLQELKRETFGNIARDEFGNPVASPAKMNAWVEKMDQGGKLDFVYGKKGAEQIRDMRDLLMDTHTSPPGSVNTSNTASMLMAFMDAGATAAVTGIPLPAITAAKYGVKYMKNKAMSKKVAAALNPEGQ